MTATANPKSDRVGRRAIWEIFATRRIVTSQQLVPLLSGAGIARRTFERVKDSAGVRSFKQGKTWAYRIASE